VAAGACRAVALFRIPAQFAAAARTAVHLPCLNISAGAERPANYLLRRYPTAISLHRTSLCWYVSLRTIWDATTWIAYASTHRLLFLHRLLRVAYWLPTHCAFCPCVAAVVYYDICVPKAFYFVTNGVIAAACCCGHRYRRWTRRFAEYDIHSAANSRVTTRDFRRSKSLYKPASVAFGGGGAG